MRSKRFRRALGFRCPGRPLSLSERPRWWRCRSWASCFRPPFVGPGAVVPPLGQIPCRSPRPLGIVRRVVEQHEPRSYGVSEVDDVEARRRLIEPIAIAAAVDAEQATEDEPDGG